MLQPIVLRIGQNPLVSFYSTTILLILASNGLNPHWNETFVFNIYRPELAILRFSVEDGDFVGPKTDPFIGQAGFPVDCIRPGYRSVPLYNQFNEPFEVSALLVHVEIRLVLNRIIKREHSDH